MTTKEIPVSPKQDSSDPLLKAIYHNTKCIFTLEQKVLIVMGGVRGEQIITELCCKYGIFDSTYYKWNKDFIETSKAHPEGDILREPLRILSMYFVMKTVA